MDYKTSADIDVVCSLLDISSSRLAEYLGVARSTVLRIQSGSVRPGELFLERFYSFAYSNPIRHIDLNALKIQFAQDAHPNLLFHGSRSFLNGEIDLAHSREGLDMGGGFYLGESYAQASSYIYPYKKSCVYLADGSKLSGLETYEYGVDLEWMITVCYYRGRLSAFSESSVLKGYLAKGAGKDVLIAPIADNNMFETMNQFARGEITDMQAISALSASSLGKQHVLKTEKACHKARLIDRLYLCEKERNEIEAKRKEAADIAKDKAKLAIIKCRREGKYIEEILL